jgi:hypothetical protein
VSDYAQAILNYTLELEKAANQIPDKPPTLSFSYLKDAVCTSHRDKFLSCVALSFRIESLIAVCL